MVQNRRQGPSCPASAPYPPSPTPKKGLCTPYTLALLLTCMGLFGLVSLNITRRMKELSIRKVLGASLGHIVHQISRELILVLLVAMAFAVPASYLLLKALYDAAGGYHIPLGPPPFVVTFVVVLLTAMLTVATHVYKAATANPVVALRDE